MIHLPYWFVLFILCAFHLQFNLNNIHLQFNLNNIHHALRCHGIICPYLSASARCFYTTLTENEVLPVLVDFN